ncbi:MAG: Kelch repeat-containing protein, partial [Syntrophothermus sp.]
MKIRYMVLFYVLLALISTSVFAQVKSDVVPKNLDQSFAPTPSLYQDRVYNDNLNIKSGILGYTFTDFEEATFPPVGWTLEFSGTQYWTRETTCSGYGFGAAAAKFNFWSASTGTTQAIVSPTFPPAIAGDSLKFDLAHAPYSATADDKLKIEYSLDGGTNWIEIITLHGADGAGNDLNTTAKITVSFTPTADQWGTRTYGLPVGANRIKLTAISGYGNNLFVDNIKVGTPPANDVGLFSFDISTDQLPGTIVPKATVKNFGSATNTFTVKMTIGTYQSTKTVTSLSPNTTAQVLFDNWAAPLGVHVVKVYTQLAGDVNAMNDTLTTMVNVSNSTWMTGGTIPISTYMGTGASVKINDTLYVYSMGGNTTPAGNTGVARYNVNSNTWTTMAPLPISRVVFTAASIGTTIYTFGGSDGTNYGTQVFKYNALTNTWTPGPDLPTTLGWGKAAAYQDSLIYIVTGLINSTTYTNNVWVFNVNTQTFRAATPIPDAVFGGAVAIFGNKIVYVGGANAGGIVGTTHVGTISQTDRSQITWAAGTAYPPGTNYRWDGGTFGSKGIIVAGGSPTSDWATPRNLAYLYNPDTDTWMQLANKPTAILGAPVGFGSVGNNVYYVMASGYTGSGTFTGTEMFTDIDLVPVE